MPRASFRLRGVFAGHARVKTTLLVALLSGGVSELPAQSLGLDLGLAGIENYDPLTPAAGISLSMPVGGRFSATATYTRWTGHDGNEASLPPGIARLGYGNQAFLLTGLLRLSDPEGLALSVGGGAGWFQHFDVIDGHAETVYDGTPVGSLLLRYQLTPRLSPYCRADVQIPTEPAVRYGLVRLGLGPQQA